MHCPFGIISVDCHSITDNISSIWSCRPNIFADAYPRFNLWFCYRRRTGHNSRFACTNIIASDDINAANLCRSTYGNGTSSLWACRGTDVSPFWVKYLFIFVDSHDNWTAGFCAWTLYSRTVYCIAIWSSSVSRRRWRCHFRHTRYRYPIHNYSTSCFIIETKETL